MFIVLLFLAALPLIELYVLIQVGASIGALSTVLAVVFTAVLGLALAQRQGLAVLREAQVALDRDEVPVKQIFDGVFLFVAGVSLLVPGFVTDALGFILLVPPLRALLGWRIWRWLQRRGGVHIVRGRHTVEAEYREVPDDEFDPDDEGTPPTLSDRRQGGGRRG